MQNWKIKRMSVKRINRCLSDIDKLIRHYEGKEKVDRCPLCIGTPCSSCLWIIIEGIDCECFAKKLCGNYGAVSYRRDLRNKRIDEIKSYQNAFDALSEVLEKSFIIEPTKNDYDSPSWAYKRADIDGSNRTIRQIIKLLNVKDT